MTRALERQKTIAKVTIIARTIMPSMSAKVTQAGALLITVAVQRRSSVIHLLLVLQAPYRITKFLLGISCWSKPNQVLL